MRLWEDRCFLHGHYSEYCSELYFGYHDDSSIYLQYELPDYYEKIEVSKEYIGRKRVPLDGKHTFTAMDGRKMIITIVEVIGSGTGSIAYLAEIDGKQCVLKQLYPQRLNDEYLLDGSSNGLVVRKSLRAKYMWHKRKKEFVCSANLQMRLCQVPCLSSYIPSLTGILSSGDTLCTLTDTFDGYSWDQQKNYTIEQVLQIIIELTKLVQYIHVQGYLVVDIKASNFTVACNAEGDIAVKLIDFDGLKKLHSKGKFKYSSETCPKEYKSHDYNQIGKWSDVYCIVALFADCVFGHHKLKRMGHNFDKSCKSCYAAWVKMHHDSIRTLLVRGLHDDYSKRIQTCQELLEYLYILL